jgi:hypothetical protein
MATTAKTPNEIASSLSTTLNIPVSDGAIHDFGDHYAVKLSYSGTLEHEQNVALTVLGRTSVKRSGAGMTINLEIIK